MVKAAEMRSSILTLALATPSGKGAGPVLGFELTPRSKTLWTRESISVVLNTSEKGRSGQLGPEYSHILIFRHQSDWFRQLKNIHRRCILVKPSYRNYCRASLMGCNLSRSFLATPFPQEGRGMRRLPVNMESGTEA
jgi:hypothetical protein